MATVQLRTRNIQRIPKTATTNQNNRIINIYAFGDTRTQTWRCHLQILYQKKESHYSALPGVFMNKLLAHLIAH